MKKQHRTEVIICILRQAETDETIDLVCCRHIVSNATFHRWKRIYRDMELADDKRLKELKKRLNDLLFKESVLDEVNAKKWQARCKRSKQ